jgi:hypothetical protein
VTERSQDQQASIGPPDGLTFGERRAAVSSGATSQSSKESVIRLGRNYGRGWSMTEVARQKESRRNQHLRIAPA